MAYHAFASRRGREEVDGAMAAIEALRLEGWPEQLAAILALAEHVEIEDKIDGRAVGVDADGRFEGIAACTVTFVTGTGASTSDEVALTVRGRITAVGAVVEGYEADLAPFV